MQDKGSGRDLGISRRQDQSGVKPEGTFRAQVKSITRVQIRTVTRLFGRSLPRWLPIYFNFLHNSIWFDFTINFIEIWNDINKKILENKRLRQREREIENISRILENQDAIDTIAMVLFSEIDMKHDGVIDLSKLLLLIEN